MSSTAMLVKVWKHRQDLCHDNLYSGKGTNSELGNIYLSDGTLSILNTLALWNGFLWLRVTLDRNKLSARKVTDFSNFKQYLRVVYTIMSSLKNATDSKCDRKPDSCEGINPNKFNSTIFFCVEVSMHDRKHW